MCPTINDTIAEKYLSSCISVRVTHTFITASITRWQQGFWGAALWAEFFQLEVEEEQEMGKEVAEVMKVLVEDHVKEDLEMEEDEEMGEEKMQKNV